jgi:hypothetical protein
VALHILTANGMRIAELQQLSGASGKYDIIWKGEEQASKQRERREDAAIASIDRRRRSDD